MANLDIQTEAVRRVMRDRAPRQPEVDYTPCRWPGCNKGTDGGLDGLCRPHTRHCERTGNWTTMRLEDQS